MLALTLSNWIYLARDLTEPSTEEAKADWDQELMPVREQFDSFEDPHGYYRIIICSKSSCDEGVDAEFNRDKKKILRMERKAHPDKLSGTPNKENVAKLKEKHKWAHNAYQKCQQAYEIMGDVEDDGSYMKRVNYDKYGEALR